MPFGVSEYTLRRPCRLATSHPSFPRRKTHVRTSRSLTPNWPKTLTKSPSLIAPPCGATASPNSVMISDFVLGRDAVQVFWIHCDTDRSMCVVRTWLIRPALYLNDTRCQYFRRTLT